MPELNAQGSVKQHSYELVLTKCACGDPLRIHPDKPCPNGLQHNMGTVAYWSHRFTQRLAYKLRSYINQQHVHWHK